MTIAGLYRINIELFHRFMRVFCSIFAQYPDYLCSGFNKR